MCKVDIRSLLEGRNYPEAGDALFEMMKDSVEANGRVVLNMEGVDSLPSMFLNASIGRYLEDFGNDSLRGKLSFEKITAQQAARIKEYISRKSDASLVKVSE